MTRHGAGVAAVWGLLALVLAIGLGPVAESLDRRGDRFALLDYQGDAVPTRKPASKRLLSEQGEVSLGLSSRPVWIAIELARRGEPHLMYLSNPLLRSASLYRRDTEDGQSWRLEAPVQEAVYRGDMATARPLFEVETPGRYLLKLNTAQALRFTIRVVTEEEMHRNWRDFLLGQGLYFGLVMGLALYNGLLLLGLRDTSYLWYVCFLIGSAGYFLCQNGLLYRAFPEMSTATNEALLLTSLAWISVSGLQFCRRFLLLGHEDPVVDRGMLAMWPLAGVGAGLAWWFPGYVTVMYFSLIGLLVLCGILGSSVRALLRGFRSARWLLLAWSALVAGAASLLLSTYGLLPHGFWSYHGFQVGSALESVLLSLALADRISLLQRERQALLSEQARLHGMSYIDGLTGVHNRRYLDEALPVAVQAAESSGRPLSLIMLDLDNFKRFNDGWGHAEGDRALQHLTAVIDEVIRDVDPVCRYGGEEFVIPLKERDARQAMEIAERIRKELAASPLSLQEGGAALLTCTLGVATRQPGETAAALLRRADQALYRGKYAGRDRAVLHSPVGSEAP
ncbi:sensor domain-containing diguanylate cyclase [Halomonas sp. V046]|uniref:sensor domain-containing diguanylate cyclase n=1 Tax=Halomonas sp. V046 TaxID=3459611 RepID=UPI0040444577